MLKKGACFSRDLEVGVGVIGLDVFFQRTRDWLLESELCESAKTDWIWADSIQGTEPGFRAISLYKESPEVSIVVMKATCKLLNF